MPRVASGGTKTTASLEPAWVLHARDYRESSRIVDLYTRDHGRIAVVARGARGPKSRTRGILQLFHPVLVSWVSRGELGTLTGVEAAGPAMTPARGNDMSGFYLNELLLRLVRVHDPNPGLFADYGTAIATLATEGPPAPALRLFEKRLLESLGYGVAFDVDADTGGALVPAAHYEYHPERGLVRAAAGSARAYPVSSLTALAAEEFTDSQVLGDAQRLLRTALDFYLDGRPLKVRDVARALVK